MQICLWICWNTSLRKLIDSSTDYVDDKKIISLLNGQRRIENVFKKTKIDKL